MSGAFGGNYSNGGFDLVKPLRRLFDGMDDRRREMVRINAEHSSAVERAAQQHAYNMELFHSQAYENANRDQNRFDHERSMQDRKFEGEGQQRLAQRTFDINKIAGDRDHEIRMERERGKQARMGKRLDAKLTRDNYDHAAGSSGPSKPVSASPTSVSGSTAPAKRTAAKKAAPAQGAKKPRAPKAPKA